jgi:hypothetical protein
MKFLLILFSALSISAANSQEYLIAQDNFDSYPTGDIAGQGGSSAGWTSSWTTAAFPYVKADTAPAPLVYSIPTRGTISSSAGCLLLTTNPEPTTGYRSIKRSFTPVKASLFIGFTFQLSTIGSGSDAFYFDLLDSAGGTIKTLTIKPLMNSAYPGFFEGGSMPNGTSATVYYELLEVRRGSVEYGGIGWINPASYSWRAINNSVITENDLAAIQFRLYSNDTIGPHTTLRIDNLKIGLTWDSVVPPLPTTAAFPNFSFEKAHRIAWYGDSTLKYRVEASDDMATWVALTSFTNGANTNMELYVPLQGASRFFRVVSAPK